MKNRQGRDFWRPCVGFAIGRKKRGGFLSIPSGLCDGFVKVVCSISGHFVIPVLQKNAM